MSVKLPPVRYERYDLEAHQVHEGYHCLLTRYWTHDKLSSGYRVGFIGLPVSHPFHNVDAMLVETMGKIKVHGGLLYSQSSVMVHAKRMPEVPTDLWWLGFDCAHWGDNETGGQSMTYVSYELQSLAKQLKKVETQGVVPSGR